MTAASGGEPRRQRAGGPSVLGLETRAIATRWAMADTRRWPSPPDGIDGIGYQAPRPSRLACSQGPPP
jgi:hypothetical protein